jgi:hypothetical protein
VPNLGRRLTSHRNPQSYGPAVWDSSKIEQIQMIFSASFMIAGGFHTGWDVGPGGAFAGVEAMHGRNDAGVCLSYTF